jgi:hypothetical protein
MLARHALASYSEGERVVLGLAPATIKNRLREAREHGVLMWGMLSTLALYGIADLWVGSNTSTQSCIAVWKTLSYQEVTKSLSLEYLHKMCRK